MSDNAYDVEDAGGGYTVAAQFDPASDPNTNFNTSTDVNSPFKRGDVFTNQTPIVSDLSGLSKFLASNKGLIAGGAALMGATGNNNAQYGKSGYQGAIPELSASRTMIAAPPTRAQGYRPGSGGIDYGGDVTYTRTPGVDPWWQLSGNTGTSAGADLTSLLSGLKTTGGVSTPVGGISNLTGGSSTVTNKNANVVNAGSTGYQNFIKGGGTPAQYLKGINQWILDNPNASLAEIQAAKKAAGISDVDVQTALSAGTNFSDAIKYALTHNMGLNQVNQNIIDAIVKNPYMSNADIQAAQKKWGISDEDIARALNEKNTSAGKEYAIIHDMGLDKFYQNINDFIASKPTAAQTQAAMKQYGISDADVEMAKKYAVDTKYTPTVIKAANTETKVDSTAAQKESDAAKLAAQKKAEADAAAEWERQNAAKWEAENAARWEAEHAKEVASQQATEAQNQSAGKQWAANHGISDDQFYSNIANFLAANPSEAEKKAAMDQYGINQQDVDMAQAIYGTTDRYAEGGMAKGRYLQGQTDGMADELPAKIGEDQPAALSHGEFVVPADVVSHLGNGNSDAGAKKLYQMMDKIRMARTGTKKQGKKINPDKFMPGGLAQAYASGGSVKKFADGGSTGTPAANFNAGLAGVESNLSNWAGPYVTNMLGQGQALANMPYQAYMGQLTAGESPLQTQAFNTAAGLQVPSSIGTAATNAGDIGATATGLKYTPTTTSFDATQAQNYMNPYLQASLNPQLEEARRQSQITQQQNAAKMTQAGAFGGSRQAILDAETQRNLGTNLANITGTGYANAYDKAMAQFNADQQRKMQEAQYGAGFGLQGLQTGLQAAQAQGALGTQESQAGINALNAQLGAGAQQRGIESEGIAADKAQFEEARANPYKMVQFQQSLLQGLPTASQSYNATQPSALQSAAQASTTVNQLLKNLGL